MPGAPSAPPSVPDGLGVEVGLGIGEGVNVPATIGTVVDVGSGSIAIKVGFCVALVAHAVITNDNVMQAMTRR